MNGRTAKILRKEAMMDVFRHYFELLDVEQRKELTLEDAVKYTPTVQYIEVPTNSYRKPYSKQTVVSENTVRWFIKQRKKTYVYEITTS